MLGALPGMLLDSRHPLATFVAQLTGSISVGKVSYITEGGLYQEAGIPTIVCGAGSIAQAHQPGPARRGGTADRSHGAGWPTLVANSLAGSVARLIHDGPICCKKESR
jgi:hypothetical protein